VILELSLVTYVVEIRSHSVIPGATFDEEGTGTPGRSRPQSLARARS
jgi:hypothetical protein